ncbi:putative membrane protein YccC [Methylopila jiangsuensis]|uniref:FUSC family protein n=1 Tax=Methylopila jiangsuensis TaxID=586230 RepID=UPI0022F2D92D|nr:FUSC family protein [Methylopila jiangsuensis]MDR6286524.1 putative membrane protein YccC [Methylopila jiangsuensis]
MRSAFRPAGARARRLWTGTARPAYLGSVTTTPSPEPAARHRRGHARFHRLAVLTERALKRLNLNDRVLNGARHAALGVAAALLAYLPPSAIGLREGFWAAITALAVTQAQIVTVYTMGRDQMLGALIGGLTGALTAFVVGKGLPAYALAVGLSVLAAWLANAGSAARLASITATIIMLIPHQTSDAVMLASRVGEVCWGVASAIIVVGTADVLQRRWTAARKDG